MNPLNTPASFLCLLLALLLAGSATHAFARDRDIEVKAVKTGKVLMLDVAFSVAAPVHEVWDVMTDWNRMEEFASGVDVSDIVSKTGNIYRVKQSGRVPVGPFKLSYESVRDIEVFPYDRMQFKGVKGSFERLDGTVRLVPAGAGTRILYRAESVPTVWVPPFVGLPMVENTTRAQFGDMRAEVLRRFAAKGGRPRTGDGAP